MAQLEVYGDNKSLQIRMENGNVYPITQPQDTTVTFHPFFKYLKDRTEDMTAEELAEYLLSDMLYINSVRYYKQGKKRWVVLHISQGELLYDYDNDHVIKEYVYNQGIDASFTTIRESYFPEPIIGHANGYDWIIEIEK